MNRKLIIYISHTVIVGFLAFLLCSLLGSISSYNIKGMTYEFLLTANTDSSDYNENVNTLKSIAINNNTNFISSFLEQKNNSSTLHIHYLEGNTTTFKSLIEQNNSSFDPSISIVYHDLTDSPQTRSIQGVYKFDSTGPHIVNDIIKALEDNGFQVLQISPTIGEVGLILKNIGQYNYFTILIVLVLLLFFSVNNYVYNRTKEDFILLTNGVSLFRIFMQKIAVQVKSLSIVSCLTLCACTIMLFFYNKLSNYGSFIYYFLIIFAVLATLIIVFTSVSTLLLSNQSFGINYLKGMRHNVLLFISSIFVMFCIVCITIISFNLNLPRIFLLENNISALKNYSEMKDYYSFTTGNGTLDDESPQKLGEFIVDSEKENKLLLIARDNSAIFADTGAATTTLAKSKEPFANNLLVNNDFLNKVHIFDERGNAIEPFDTTNTAYILLPKNLSYLQSTLEERLAKYLSSTKPKNSENAMIKTISTMSDQRIINFNDGDDAYINGSYYSDNPVIVVLPCAHIFLSSLYFQNFISNSQILYHDSYSQAELAVEYYGVDKYINSIKNVYDTSVKNIADLQFQINMFYLSVFLSLLLNLFIALIMVWILFINRAKYIFLQYVNGNSYLSRYWKVLVVVALLPIVAYLVTYFTFSIMLELLWLVLAQIIVYQIVVNVFIKLLEKATTKNYQYVLQN